MYKIMNYDENTNITDSLADITDKSGEILEDLRKDLSDLDPDKNFNNDAFGLDRSVFTHGLPEVVELARFKCPVCGSVSSCTSNITRRRLFKKRILGVAKICAECGHVDIFMNSFGNLDEYIR